MSDVGQTFAQIVGFRPLEQLAADPPLGTRLVIDARVGAILALHGCTQYAVFAGNKFRVIVSVDRGRLHASVSHTKRYPTWDEIKVVREWYFPHEMEVVMYVNLSPTPNCFHLWQSACGQEGQ